MIIFLMYTFVKSLLKVKNKLVSPVLNDVKSVLGWGVRYYLNLIGKT